MAFALFRKLKKNINKGNLRIPSVQASGKKYNPERSVGVEVFFQRSVLKQGGGWVSYGVIESIHWIKEEQNEDKHSKYE